MKRILITGSNGQLGHALNKILMSNSAIEIRNTDIDTLDIGDYAQVDNIVKEFNPHIIINCAAYTAVDDCENNQEKAYYINAKGPENLAKASELQGAKLVHISTDYVFDGNKKVPYIESDVTNPQSIYGTSKLCGEHKVMEFCSSYFIIRTAWLYGEGKNFVRTMLRLANEKNEISIVSDQYGTPTSALELARLIEYLMDTEAYGIYHGTCEGETNWYQFALAIFERANIKISVNPISSAQFNSVAKRPAYSVLENNKLNRENTYRMKSWENALDEYMEEELRI